MSAENTLFQGIRAIGVQVDSTVHYAARPPGSE